MISATLSREMAEEICRTICATEALWPRPVENATRRTPNVR
jgi:hypothetical protein